MQSKSPTQSDALAKLRIQRTDEFQPRAHKRRSVFRSLFGFLTVVVLVIACFFVAVYAGWLEQTPSWFKLPEGLQPRVEVRLALVSRESGRSADATVVATGYLESRRQAKIGARAPGRIELVNVEEGSRVRAKEVLAVLEHADLVASLAGANASLARSKAEIIEQRVLIDNNKLTLDRAEQLRRTNTIAIAEYEQAKYQYDAAVAKLATLEAAAALAEARVKEAEQMKENMFVRAPFDGTVISKDGEVGESILPGGMGEASGRGSVVTIADLDHLEVDADVKEDYISRVRIDQNAEVAVDAVPNHRFRGKVRKIIPMGDRARATIKVKVAITDSDGRLFPDMSATVYFLPNDSEAIASTEPRVFCSSEAIREDQEGKFVWEIDASDRLRRKPIKDGNSRDGRTEILEGLTGSERIAIAPSQTRVGQLVKVAQ